MKRVYVHVTIEISTLFADIVTESVGVFEQTIVDDWDE